MVKIRLMRIGAKGKPFYRVVAIDERNKRNGAYLELLGTYNPLTEPKEIKLKQERIDDWVKKGAQLSNGFLRVIGKAPQRPPRKPKKQKEESSGKGGQAASRETQDSGGSEASSPRGGAGQNDNQKQLAEQQAAEEVVSEPEAKEEEAKE